MEAFGNGRDITTWANRVYRAVANRRFGSESAENKSEKVCLDDLQQTLAPLLQELRGCVPSPSLSSKPPTEDPVQFETPNPLPPPTPVVVTAHETQAQAKSKPPPAQQPENNGDLSREEWNSLNDALAGTGILLPLSSLSPLSPLSLPFHPR
jgi:hypothetical protein